MEAGVQLELACVAYRGVMLACDLKSGVQSPKDWSASVVTLHTCIQEYFLDPTWAEALSTVTGQ